MIIIDINKTKTQINKLRNSAGEISDANARVNSICSDIQSFWQGDAALAYEMELKEWNAKMSKTANDIYNITMVIERVSEELRKADEKIAANTTSFV